MASSSIFFLYCLIISLCTSSVWGLQVTPNSPCSKTCMDDPTADVSDPNVSNTNVSDIVCNDADYEGTAVGRKFKECLTCLQNSTAESGTESDQGWFFYNLRYAFNTCLFNSTNVTDSVSTPCATSGVCATLQSPIEQDLSDVSTMGGGYSYCNASNNAFTGDSLGVCQSCLRENTDVYYLSNFLVALDAGCLQEPANKTVVGLNGTLFADTQISITNPITTSTSTPSKPHKKLSTGAIIGIAVAGAIVLLVISAIAFIQIRKRRNASRLLKLRSPLDERFGAENITAPNKGAYSSPQTSPGFHKDSIQMMQAPPVRNFSFSRPLQNMPKRAGEWTGAPSPGTPSTTFSGSNAGSPPGYDERGRPRVESGDSFPAHHAYIPPGSQATTPLPDYTNPNSPAYVAPPAPPQPHPQRSPSSVNSTSPGYRPTHTAKSPSVGSMRSPPLSSTSTMSRTMSKRGPPTINPSLPNINQTPNPSPGYSFSNSRNNSNQPSPNFTVGISAPLPRETGGRFEGEDEARMQRERLYRDGLAGRTLVHGRESVVEEVRNSPDSESSEELWPGSY